MIDHILFDGMTMKHHRTLVSMNQRGRDNVIDNCEGDIMVVTLVDIKMMTRRMKKAMRMVV
jgi:hypothetical protein